MSGGKAFWLPLPGGGGGILATHVYSPGTQASIGTSSASFVDVDATNMAVAFVAPASGEVIVDVSATVYVPAALGIDWGLRLGSSDVAGTNKRVAFGSSGDRSHAVTLRNIVVGLTPGASYTYKLAHRVGVGTGTVDTRFGGSARGNAGAAVFVVYELP